MVHSRSEMMKSTYSPFGQTLFPESMKSSTESPETASHCPGERLTVAKGFRDRNVALHTPKLGLSARAARPLRFTGFKMRFGMLRYRRRLLVDPYRTPTIGAGRKARRIASRDHNWKCRGRRIRR